MAAWALTRSELIVIDAGTATTMTLWSREGCCGGGMIAPGRQACLQGSVKFGSWFT